MIRQVAVLRNGRGHRKGTLMKAQAELPSLRIGVLGLAPVPDGLVRRVFARRLFSGTDSLPAGALAPSGPHLVQHGVAGNPPLRLDRLNRARWCLLISEMECQERNRWHLNMGAGVKLLMRKAGWTDDSAQKFR